MCLKLDRIKEVVEFITTKIIKTINAFSTLHKMMQRANTEYRQRESKSK